MNIAEDFRQFMACMVAVEGLQKLSSQSLLAFQQHLEAFRRPPLSETSTVIANLVTVAPSARLTRYLEAGGWHEDPARLVAAKLDSALKGLWTHIRQAQAALLELESFVRRAGDLLQLDHCAQLETVEISSSERESEEDVEAHQQPLEPQESFVRRASNMIQSKLCSQLKTVEISSLETDSVEDFEAHQQPLEPVHSKRRLQTSDYVHMMTLILTMLVEEFKMQEKIVHALGLDTPTEALQSYSLMWELRPFVDDVVVEQALSWSE